MISSIRNYWSDGRGPDLYRYAAMAYGVAVLEFAISPDHFALWLGLWHRNYPNAFFLIPFIGMFWWPSIAVLTIAWLAIVVRGFMLERLASPYPVSLYAVRSQSVYVVGFAFGLLSLRAGLLVSYDNRFKFAGHQIQLLALAYAQDVGHWVCNDAGERSVGVQFGSRPRYRSVSCSRRIFWRHLFWLRDLLIFLAINSVEKADTFHQQKGDLRHTPVERLD